MTRGKKKSGSKTMHSGTTHKKRGRPKGTSTKKKPTKRKRKSTRKKM